MVAKALVGSEANRYGLVSPVHRHQSDVDVNQKVRLCRPPGNPYFFAELGFTEHNKFGSVLSVEIVKPVGPQLREDALADHAANFSGGHAPMKRGRHDYVDVVNPIGGSGRLMSSTAMVTRMFGFSCAKRGGAFSGWRRA